MAGSTITSVYRPSVISGSHFLSVVARTGAMSRCTRSCALARNWRVSDSVSCRRLTRPSWASAAARASSASATLGTEAAYRRRPPAASAARTLAPVASWWSAASRSGAAAESAAARRAGSAQTAS